MLKDFVDSPADWRPHLRAVKYLETTVSSGYPKWKQVGSKRVLEGNRKNACSIPSLLLPSAYGYGLTQDTGPDGLLLWADIAGLMYQKTAKLYLNYILCKRAHITRLQLYLYLHC